MSCLDDLNDFYDFYGFYGLPFTVYRLLLTKLKTVIHK
jgi:hypothetical protein